MDCSIIALSASTRLSNDNSIMLSVGWKGTNKMENKELSVQIVDLIFKDSRAHVSVHIPDTIDPARLNFLPFHLKKDQNETTPKSLNVAIEKLRKLTVNVNFIEENKKEDHDSKNPSGIISRLSEKIIPNIPQILEIGQEYRLVFTSNDLKLSVNLVKEAVNSEENAKPPALLSPAFSSKNELLSRQLRIIHYLKQTLGPTMMENIQMFEENLFYIKTNQKSAQSYKVLCVNSIMIEVNKIDPQKLKTVVEEISALEKLQPSNPSNEELLNWERKVVTLCFEVISDDGLVNIMKRSLESVVPNAQISGFKQIIEDLSNVYLIDCKKMLES